jgi:hypothetical protein
MNQHYENLASPPKDALKKIDFGALRGKSDINPQWRYEALTKEFGLCGQGWKFEIVNTWTEPVPATHELMIFALVNLYIKEGDEWSAPIPGFGGDFLIVSNKSGVKGNDEGYKMAVTDALGTAAKMVGVAADVYRGRMESKYSRRAEADQEPAKAKAEPKAAKTKAADPKVDYKSVTLRKIAAAAKEIGLTGEDVKGIIFDRYKKDSSAGMTDAEVADLESHLVEYAAEYKDTEAIMMGESLLHEDAGDRI